MWRLRRRHDRLETYRSVVSHDLRTPLNVAQGYLDLARSSDAEEAEELLETVGDALDRMERYLIDLQTLEKQGTPIGEVGHIEIADVVERAWESVETGEAVLHVGTTATAAGDRERLSEAFRNIYQNSIDHGGSDVTVTVGDIENEGFYVEDDGPGPTQGEYDDLFKPGFSTTDGATGLGLAIVAQIVAAHRWSVSASEGSDGGVRIEFADIEATPIEE